MKSAPSRASLSTASITYADPVSRYDFISIIGSGSYGRVFSAADRFLAGAAVAIKSIPLEELDDGEAARAELAREADVLRRCDCPFIVAYHGAFYHERTLYVATALCEAGSLLDVLRAQQHLHGTASFTEPALLAIAAGTCAALAYLHDTAHVLHRDLKAANLLLTAHGKLQLCDFGISAQLTSTMPNRSTAIGTPHWMAPEVIGGGEYATSADVWSLGITMIECAQGAHLGVEPPAWKALSARQPP